MVFHVTQSVPICLGLAAMGGAIEVLATAVLAFQDAQEKKQGVPWSLPARYASLGLHLILQITSSIVGNLFAPWFGPVSIVGPVFLSSQLLANMVVFGMLLGLEMFTKDMRVGTYIVVIAVVLLPIVGPTVQDFEDDIWDTWYSLLWCAVQVLGMTVSFILILVMDVPNLPESRAITLLLFARATAFTVNLTVSKIMIMHVSYKVLLVLIILKLFSGGIITYALVIQSTAVTQAKFVPLNASSLILVNALTGMIVWQDWRVVGNWVGYACIFLQLVLGNYLLLGDVELLSPENTNYGRAKSIILTKSKLPRNSLLFRIDEEDRDGETQDQQPNGGYLELEDSAPQTTNGQASRRQQRRQSTTQEAWSSVYGLDPASRHVPRRRQTIFIMEDSIRDLTDYGTAELTEHSTLT